MNQSIKIDPFGFREYDARWIYEKDINIKGISNLGKGLGTQIIKHTKKNNPRVIVGHDYRSYSEEVKKNFIDGLLSTGCNVEDIGLCLSPTVYYSQFKLNSDAVAMITASHNENGWTGIKMGIEKGLTHCKEEMSELRDIVLNKNFITGNGSYKKIENFNKTYIGDLSVNKIKKKIKVVAACGNGTAGIFAPNILKEIHSEYISLGAKLIISNTFATCKHTLEDAQQVKNFGKLNSEGVRLALEARSVLGAEDVMVGGGISYWSFTGRNPSLSQLNDNISEQASILANAGSDLLILEMMKDVDRLVVTLEAALKAGLPVWVGLSCKKNIDGNIVPSLYAKVAREMGLDIIAWTLERSDALALGGGWYYSTIADALEKDSDLLNVLNVLVKEVGIKAIFTDWAATATFYANCNGLLLK